jgi:hypothetical protein
MDAEQFWELNVGLAPENAVQQLRDRLSSLDPEEIVSYQEHFDRAFASAYTWDLWGAAYIIDGGCSDDGFMDFRYGLIARGRTVFEAAIANPESLVDVADDTPAGLIANESFGYVARQAYETKVNQDMPNNDVAHPFDPTGDDWDFDDEQLCQQKLPKLWSKYGG